MLKYEIVTIKQTVAAVCDRCERLIHPDFLRDLRDFDSNPRDAEK